MIFTPPKLAARALPALALALGVALAASTSACSKLDLCETNDTQEECAQDAAKCSWNGSTGECQDQTVSGPSEGRGPAGS